MSRRVLNLKKEAQRPARCEAAREAALVQAGSWYVRNVSAAPRYFGYLGRELSPGEELQLGDDEHLFISAAPAFVRDVCCGHIRVRFGRAATKEQP